MMQRSGNGIPTGMMSRKVFLIAGAVAVSVFVIVLFGVNFLGSGDNADTGNDDGGDSIEDPNGDNNQENGNNGEYVTDLNIEVVEGFNGSPGASTDWKAHARVNEEGNVLYVSYGSSSCPATAEKATYDSVSGNVDLSIVKYPEDTMCTMDIVPHAQIISHPDIDFPSGIDVYTDVEGLLEEPGAVEAER